MPERLRGYRDRVDPQLYSRACAVEGYFTESEASLLIRAIRTAGPSPVYLEIGSFRGRSTLFALSAMPAAVDCSSWMHSSTRSILCPS
jgi:predicted O-methyltransferase YrrM